MRLVRLHRRRGFSLIWVLVLITLTAAVSVELTRHILMARQQAVATENSLQAEWLARAGITWGASKLRLQGAKTTLGKLPGDNWPGTCEVAWIKSPAGQEYLEATATSGVAPFTQKRVLRQSWSVDKDPKPSDPLRWEHLEPRK
ncbi:MAG: hypothetical protein ACKOS8_08710 [Gemmataceae bacterium]